MADFTFQVTEMRTYEGYVSADSASEAVALLKPDGYAALADYISEQIVDLNLWEHQ